MKSFKKFVEEYKQAENINEAEFNQAWWNSKSDNFKKRYIEKHPNSIYAKKFGNGKLDKQIASKKYHADADQKRFERDVSGNKSWMGHMAKRGLDKDRKGGKPIEALTPRYRKNLIRGAEDRYGKDSKQASRARELWGDQNTNSNGKTPLLKAKSQKQEYDMLKSLFYDKSFNMSPDEYENLKANGKKSSSSWAPNRPVNDEQIDLVYSKSNKADPKHLHNILDNRLSHIKKWGIEALSSTDGRDLLYIYKNPNTDVNDKKTIEKVLAKAEKYYKRHPEDWQTEKFIKWMKTGKIDKNLAPFTLLDKGYEDA